MNEAAQEFFTWTALGTLAGATTAVVVVTNTLRRVIGWRTPVVPFAVSLAVTIGLAGRAGTLSGIEGWTIAFLNGCLVFCTATGAQETAVEVATPGPAGGTRAQAASIEKPPWLSSWLRHG